MQESAETVFIEYIKKLEAGGKVDFQALLIEHPLLEDDLRVFHKDYEDFRKVDGGYKTDHGMGNPDEWNTTVVKNLIEELNARRKGKLPHEPHEEFASGGMGEIRSGTDLVLNRKLAIKRIKHSHVVELGRVQRHLLEHIVGRFLVEAQITAQLAHPGVVPVYELGLDDEDQLYITMPRVEGLTLTEVIAQVHRDNQQWNLSKALNVLVRVIETVGFAHGRGVIHRDLKPDNIMVGQHGEVYVMDWGLAAKDGNDKPESIQSLLDGIQADQSPVISLDGKALGTAPYAAPEITNGVRNSVGLDVYSLGSILYQLLSGKAPYSELTDSRAIWAKLSKEGPRSIASVAKYGEPELVSIVEKAMHRNPQERYSDAHEMLRDLEAFSGGRVVGAYESGAWPELRKWVLRNKGVAAAVAATLLALLVGVVSYSVVQNIENRSIADRARQKAQQVQQEKENAQKLMGTAAYSAAVLSIAKGDFASGLESLDLAEESRSVDPVDVLIRRADCLMSQLNFPAAWQLLQKLKVDIEGGAVQVNDSQKAQFLLRLAYGSWGTLADGEFSRLELVREALDLGLPEAEEFLAKAYLAEHTAEALSYLGASLELEPYHRQANDQYMSLLMLYGRVDEIRTRAQVYKSIYPQDPLPDIALACVAVFEDSELDLEKHLAQLAAILPADSHDALSKLFPTILSARRLIDGDAFLGALDTVAIAKTALKYVELAPALESIYHADWNRLTVSPPLKSVTNLSTAFASAVPEGVGQLNSGTSVMDLIKTIQGAEEAFWRAIKESSKYHNDGFTRYINLMNEILAYPMVDGQVPREETNRWLAELDEIRQATTIIPAVDRAAAFKSLDLRTAIYRKYKEAAVKEAALADLVWLVSHDDLGKKSEAKWILNRAISLEEWEIAIDLCNRRISKSRMPQKDALVHLFTANMELGRYAEARRTLEQ